MRENTYYYKLAIKTAADLREHLEGCNKTYREGLELCQAGGRAIWDIRTPVNGPINSNDQYNLITLAAEKSEKKITIDYLSNETDTVNAYIKIYEDDNGDYAKVVISKYNYCRTRYLVCKELLHLFLYDTGSATTSTGDLNKIISNLLQITKDIDGIEDQYNVEQAAYFGAVELLVPTKIVPALRAARDELQKVSEFAEKANYEIAKKLGVPESLIEFRLVESVDTLFEEALPAE